MRILIAEDEVVSRELLTRYLREWGHEPIVTRDGPEALQALWPEEGPRVAILDWMMPGLEGPEVVRRLRATENERGERRPIYFLLLTSRDATVDVVHAFRAGANDYIKKPFHKDELRARVEVGIRMQELQEVLSLRVRELEDALRKVHTLQGLLPICSYCKKIRDDQNYWTDVESYIAEYSDAEFSHGVCPDCFATHLQPRLDELRRAGVQGPRAASTDSLASPMRSPAAPPPRSAPPVPDPDRPRRP